MLATLVLRVCEHKSKCIGCSSLIYYGHVHLPGLQDPPSYVKRCVTDVLQLKELVNIHCTCD